MDHEGVPVHLKPIKSTEKDLIKPKVVSILYWPTSTKRFKAIVFDRDMKTLITGLDNHLSPIDAHFEFDCIRFESWNIN